MTKLEILWSPSGTNLPSLGVKSLIDISDGDTPNIRMPIRMLSIDTPEVTAKSPTGAAKVDAKFKQLATWIAQGKSPVTASFADYILPKLTQVAAGTLQFNQGKLASAHYQEVINKRLTKPNGSQRKLYIRSPEPPFDHFGRLLAYVAPSYSPSERAAMTRLERATFNLDMLASGWAAPFVLFPNIPNEADLPLVVDMCEKAINQGLGQYQEPLSMAGYEYRMCEKLYQITRQLVAGKSMSEKKKLSWRSRYCADMRNRQLYLPEGYFIVPPPYRLWIWPDDLPAAIGVLNLIPQY
ncbi:nuclease [Thalassotalea euphylliae]|uniref:Nuclease n=1 Tax=Thalassotalea euphylliae TaxID=1655234 RepID=A0A3E0TVU3_9GAMM|nr:nuclease [Thalassotalea euphylliae]REL28507.1 nuclease [Thalassotalea euphylliae]